MVNWITEKSPKEDSVLTRAFRSRISGTEKLAFSTPAPGALWRM